MKEALFFLNNTVCAYRFIGNDLLSSWCSTYAPYIVVVLPSFSYFSTLGYDTMYTRFFINTNSRRRETTISTNVSLTKISLLCRVTCSRNCLHYNMQNCFYGLRFNCFGK